MYIIIIIIRRIKQYLGFSHFSENEIIITVCRSCENFRSQMFYSVFSNKYSNVSHRFLPILKCRIPHVWFGWSRYVTDTINIINSLYVEYDDNDKALMIEGKD